MPTSPPVLYTEHPNGRIYQVVDVDGYPADANGVPCKCVACDDEQRIELSRSVHGGERAALIAEVMGLDVSGGAVWRLAPVRGEIRTGQLRGR